MAEEGPCLDINDNSYVLAVDRALTLFATPLHPTRFHDKCKQYHDGVVLFTQEDTAHRMQVSEAEILSFKFLDEKKNLDNFRFFYADLYRLFPGAFSSWCDSSAYLKPTWSNGGQLTLEFSNPRMYATPLAAKRLCALLINSNYK